MLSGLAADRGVRIEWFSTSPGAVLRAPGGAALDRPGLWSFLWIDRLPEQPASEVGLIELDDTLDAEEISTFGGAHNPDFEGFLGGYGAQYVYVLDAGAIEGRHWNNDGVLEDVATGSAAGCVAAYLMRHGRARDGQELSLAPRAEHDGLSTVRHAQGPEDPVLHRGTVCPVPAW